MRSFALPFLFAAALAVSGCSAIAAKTAGAPAPVATPAPYVPAVAAPAAIAPAPARPASLTPVAGLEAPSVPAYVAPALAASPVVNVPAPVVNVAAPSVTVAAAPVEIRWGDYALELAKFLAGFGSLAFGLVLGLVKNPLIRAALQAYFSERKIAELTGRAINAVEGAARGKALEIDVGNAVIAKGLQFAIDELPAHAIKSLGGEEGIRAKLIGALHLDEGASESTVG